MEHLMSLMEKNEAAGREAQRAEGERSEAAGGSAAPEAVPDPELTERPKRRHFSAEYKLAVLKEADACKKQGELGALLRREGLYSSHLSTWRAQRDAGTLGRKRGRKAADPLEAENAELRRRAERAEAELAKARKVIEVQGNVSALLEDLLGTESAEEGTER
jgi:transposase-like protein